MFRTLRHLVASLALAASALLAVQPLLAAEPAPDEVLRTTTDDVITAIRQDHDLQAGDRRKAYALVESKIVPHFDFTAMTRLALGKNWAKATPDQQAQVTDAFRNLLVRTYSSALTRFRNQTFSYKPWAGNPGDTRTQVQSVVSDGQRSVPLDYAMVHGDGGWKIYDIKVDGISLVTNYRDDFNARVASGGIDGLIHDLQDKARAAETAKPAADAKAR